MATYRLLVRVIELGSFTRAAHELGLGQPAVSKQVAALETSLATRLLERTSRGLRPTPAGLELYTFAVQLLEDIEEAEARVRSGSVRPAGLVRVAMPPALGRMYIIPRLPAFVARYPEIEIEFSVGQRLADFVKDGIDVALRIGNLTSSALVARTIGSMEMITVAAPAYLAAHGRPETLRELAHHKLIAGHLDGAILEWRFKGEEGTVSITPTTSLRSNDGEDLRAAVKAGLGILHGPSALFHADLREGTVVRVLESYASDAPPVQILSSGGRKLPYRVRVVTDFLAEALMAEPGLIGK